MQRAADRFWEQPSLTQVGRLPMSAIQRRPAIELDGTWRFQLLDHPEAALGPTWREIQVPGCWTMQDTGDLPHYTNVQMPFAELAPLTPEHNPTGVYERDFSCPGELRDGRVVLHIGAAESVVKVEVNDRFIGLSKDSHLAAEFDISSAVRAGSNTVRLTVVKWSDASFIEDQDQWWHGGLTRSVYVYGTARTHLADVVLLPTLDDSYRHGTLRARVALAGPIGAEHSLRIRATELGVETHQPLGAQPTSFPDISLPEALAAHDEFHSQPPQRDLESYTTATRRMLAILGRTDDAVTPIELSLLDRAPVSTWSHESPQLYPVTVELLRDDEVIDSATISIGFRRIDLVGDEFRINGAPVLIRGVNRHDTHPRTGRVVSEADLRNDLVQMKRFGFNAVRTAHYPNAPRFLELCDELGLYVFDEANIESHAYRHSLCDDPSYLTAWVERVGRMVVRDRNHPSVLAWSLGNESGAGSNHAAAAAWVRAVDPDRLLHYEGAITRGWDDHPELTDLICPMYPGVEAIVAHATSGERRAPLVMCEYSHAMGNSNGGLSDYWEAIESTPGLQGGFIWEWADHALERQQPDGSSRLVYGGGFGDEPNDGAFCLDGIMFADRSPKPAAFEHQRIALPIAARLVDDHVEITNKLHFSPLSTLKVDLEAMRDGYLISAAPLELPAAAPGGTVRVRPSFDLSQVEHLTLSVSLAHDTVWASAGTQLGSLQITCPAAEDRTGWVAPAGGQRVALDDAGRLVHPLLTSPPELCLWRAPIDNETVNHRHLLWHSYGLSQLEREVIDVAEDDNGTRVSLIYRTAKGIAIPVVEQWWSQDSVVTSRVVVELPESLSDVPRVGIRMRAPMAEQVSWHGLGPHESYPDRQLSARIGRWSSSPLALHTPYLRPQESGGRAGVRSFRLEGAAPLEVQLDEPRQVSWSPYSVEQLTAVEHHDDLVAGSELEIIIDAAHRGLGTASCGPDTAPRHRLGPGRYELAWSLRAV